MYALFIVLKYKPYEYSTLWIRSSKDQPTNKDFVRINDQKPRTEKEKKRKQINWILTWLSKNIWPKKIEGKNFKAKDLIKRKYKKGSEKKGKQTSNQPKNIA